MARDLQPIVKRSRREGYALHPKAHKALVKRSTIPGQHGRSQQRMKASQYSLQLREKQKVKRLYGLLERQFAKLMEEASRAKGQSGDRMLEFLERRLDNAVYRAGFAPSRRAARQLVTHGHFIVNDRRTDVPSMLLGDGDAVAVREGSRSLEYFKGLGDLADARTSPNWLNRNTKDLSGVVQRLPERAEIDGSLNEQLIVEYYSR